MNRMMEKKMKPEIELDVKRILVALDASPSCMASLDMAAGLAAHMQAQLETLFVEDVGLFRLAALPFAAELDRASGEARSMDEAGIESALHLHVERLRRRLDWFSEHKQIQYKLRTVRGDYLTEALQADSDILFMFASNRVSMTESNDSARPGALRSVRRSRAPVYTLYYGEEQSAVSLKVAADIASLLGTELVIVLPPESRETPEKVQNTIKALVDHRINLNFKSAQSDFASTMIGLARSDCGLLVLPKHVEEIGFSQKRALQLLQCPVVMVGE